VGEVGDVAGGDPRRAEMGVDLARPEIGGLHCGQGVEVDLTARIGGGPRRWPVWPVGRKFRIVPFTCHDLCLEKSIRGVQHGPAARTGRHIHIRTSAAQDGKGGAKKLSESGRRLRDRVLRFVGERERPR
jgi:hypothetical protein